MVQASHLAISSPALLSFVRAYLWQLERTGKVPDSEDAEEQQAAKAAAQALYSTARSREQQGMAHYRLPNECGRLVADQSRC